MAQTYSRRRSASMNIQSWKRKPSQATGECNRYSKFCRSNNRFASIIAPHGPVGAPRVSPASVGPRPFRVARLGPAAKEQGLGGVAKIDPGQGQIVVEDIGVLNIAAKPLRA